MGFFSWKTSDTKETIWNVFTGRQIPVYLYTPDEHVIPEKSYEGYGVFGGHDVFELLVKWNCPEKWTGDTDKDRLIGIDLENPKYPLKFSFNPRKTYADLEPAQKCETQGYFDEEFVLGLKEYRRQQGD